MRLRIQTCNPLPEIRAWFIPDAQSVPASVYDLKEALCLNFQALKAWKLSGKDLILLLDDFELLDGSPFSAVRDGDLLCVKLLPSSQADELETKQVVGESNITGQRKRKRSQSAMLLIPSQSVRTPTVSPSLKRKAIHLSEPCERSDSESDTSTSTSSSSSSSPSSSSTSPSPSSSSSTTSSSSPPKLLTSQLIKQPINTMTAPNSASRMIPLVPPGLGKPSTHSRNKRRRLKKGYEKEVISTTLPADTPGPPKGSSHTNKLPLGQRKSDPGSSSYPPDGDTFGILLSGMTPKHLQNEHMSESYITPNQVIMGSLRNKNKKKGFKQSMAGPIPQKITFTTNTTGSGSQRSSSSAQNMLVDEPSTSSSTIQPRLIPPSEIQELGQLPSNMFVTSVDVESRMWNKHRPSPRKKSASNGGPCPATTDFHDSSQMEGITSGVSENGRFDDADDGQALRPFDWDRAERLWMEFAVVEKLEQLAIGCLVGWKGLAMNPQTFTPEILLTVARVINIHPESDVNDKSAQTIVIRYLERPGAGRAVLAFGLKAAIGFKDEEVEDDEETIEWTEFLAKQYRLINL